MTRAGVLCRAVECDFLCACIDVAKHAASARGQGRRTTGALKRRTLLMFFEKPSYARVSLEAGMTSWAAASRT